MEFCKKAIWLKSAAVALFFSFSLSVQVQAKHDDSDHKLIERIADVLEYQGALKSIAAEQRLADDIADVIADAFLQNTLLKPEEYSVIATLNLNGDYISDQLAAMVGGIGINGECK